MLYNAQVRKCQSLIIEYYHNPMLCKIGFIMPCAIVLPDISILLQISRFLTKQHLLQNINRSHGISPFSPCYVTVESIQHFGSLSHWVKTIITLFSAYNPHHSSQLAPSLITVEFKFHESSPGHCRCSFYHTVITTDAAVNLCINSV